MRTDLIARPCRDDAYYERLLAALDERFAYCRDPGKVVTGDQDAAATPAAPRDNSKWRKKAGEKPTHVGNRRGRTPHMRLVFKGSLDDLAEIEED